MSQFSLDIDGVAVKIEAEEPSGQMQAGPVEELSVKFEEALSIIKQIASSYVEFFTDIGHEKNRPREATLSFGLKVDGEASWVIAKVGGGANLQVSLTWEVEKQDESS